SRATLAERLHGYPVLRCPHLCRGAHWRRVRVAFEMQQRGQVAFDLRSRAPLSLRHHPWATSAPSRLACNNNLSTCVRLSDLSRCNVSASSCTVDQCRSSIFTDALLPASALSNGLPK